MLKSEKGRKIIEGQLFQIIFVCSAYWLFSQLPLFSGIPDWVLLFGIFTSLAHQLWVSFFWRIRLYGNIFSNNSYIWFNFYKIGFIILAAFRVGSIIIICLYDTNYLNLKPWIQISTILSILIVSGYAMYSVFAYFGINRAFGGDHFFPEMTNAGYVNEGIFKLTSNGMYTFAVLFIYLFGLVWDSPAGLIIAGFHHIHLWVHYYVTEKPDMAKIYGTG